jgi:hypothetical protein
VEAGDGDLPKQVHELLRRRPGWSLQATSTPGAPPLWCYSESGAETDLSLAVDKRSISVYVTDTDQTTRFESTSELVAWLNAHKPGSLREPAAGTFDRIKRGSFFRWS